MLTVKQASKCSRGFLSPLLFFNLNLNNKSISLISATSPSSSSSSSPTTTSLSYFFCYHYSTATAAAVQSITTSSRNLEAKDVVSIFKGWFKRGNNELFDLIFDTIRKHGDDKETLALSLSHLSLPLNESFVLDVLRYGSARKEIYSCVKFFDWAGHMGGFFHTQVTFNAFFKLLLNSEGMSVMLEFLDGYCMLGDVYVHHNLRFYTILVMGYAIAGKPDVALQLFGRMRFRGLDLDVFPYHVLLNSLIEHSCFEGVEVIFQQISLRGYETSITNFLKVKCLCKKKLLDEAEAYFLGAVYQVKADRCKSSDSFGYAQALRALVDASCQKGLSVKVGKLIGEVSKLGWVPMEPAYEIWLKHLVRAGKIDVASEFLKSKKSLEGYVPKIFLYNFLLFRLLKRNRLEDACDLLIEMKENHLSADEATMNAALCFFCKAGMIDVALELYNSKLEIGFSPNTMAYNYLINSLCEVGNYYEACSLLKNSVEQNYFPGKKTFAVLADALCRQGKLDMMMDLVRLAGSRNFVLRNSTYEKLIPALCKARRVEDAYLLHGEFNRSNKVASENYYISLIYGFSKTNRGDIASRLLIEMQDKGHMPTRSLFRAVISCLCNMENPEMHFFKLLEMQLSRHTPNCRVYNFFIYGAGHGKKPELAREAFNMMQRNGIRPNYYSNILMLKAYLGNERISDAINFFVTIPDSQQSKKLYDAMVVGLCNVGRTDLTLEYLEEMRSKAIVPTMTCYEAVVKLLCSTRNYDMVLNIINDLKKCGLSLTSFLGNVLLFHSTRSTELYEAWLRSRDLQNETSSDLSSLGLLIGAFSGCLTMSQEIENWEKAIAKCFPLNLYTYNFLLARLSMSNIELARQLFDRICMRGYEPNQWTYKILARGLFKHGRKAEAWSWEREMLRKGLDPN